MLKVFYAKFNESLLILNFSGCSVLSSVRIEFGFSLKYRSLPYTQEAVTIIKNSNIVNIDPKEVWYLNYSSIPNLGTVPNISNLLKFFINKFFFFIINYYFNFNFILFYFNLLLFN